MNQARKAEHFTSLHVKGNPIVLFNIWDAGSAKAVEEAGAKAIATGSHSVAAAHGFDDSEAIPLDLVELNTQQICSAVALPVTIDFEGGYAKSPDEVAINVRRIIGAGAIGINFEDQIVNGKGLYSISAQCDRINGIREAAGELGVPVFINTRTDLFLQAAPDQSHAYLIDDAKVRVTAYEDAGASGFFVPGLQDESLINELCDHTSLPVNIMMKAGVPSISQLSELGVSRVSFGPGPYSDSMRKLSEQARRAFA